MAQPDSLQHVCAVSGTHALLLLLQRLQRCQTRASMDQLANMYGQDCSWLVHDLHVLNSHQSSDCMPCSGCTTPKSVRQRYDKLHLVTCRLLGGPLVALFLRFVLDQLSKPADSKMYAFGIQTLRCFQNQLQQWPQVCQALVNMPHLQHTNPDIFASAAKVLGLPYAPFSTSSSDETAVSSSGFNSAGPSKAPGAKGPGQNAAAAEGAGRDNGPSSAGAAGDGERGLLGEAMQEDKVVPQPHAAVQGRGVTQEISPPGQSNQVGLPPHMSAVAVCPCCYKVQHLILCSAAAAMPGGAQGTRGTPHTAHAS